LTAQSRLGACSIAEAGMVRYSVVEMTEIVFVVEEAEEGGYNAYAVGQSIYTQADSLKELHTMVRDAVICHFDDGDPQTPKIIRLHFVRDEVIPLTAA
jgi:hypothetical protein